MAGPTVPTSLSRRRPAPTGDEEASAILKLGEYEDTPCLSVAECNILLDHIIGSGGRTPLATDIYIKTKEYVQMFSRFKDQSAVTHVDTLLDGLVKQGKIVPFEKAQLGEWRSRAMEGGRLWW
jgi:DNA-directed RNA polymerase II subunit RPB4